MKRSISFRLFRIKNSDKSIKAPQLRKALSERTQIAQDIGKRLMPLKESNPDSDIDVLSSFANAEESRYFYGVIMRFTLPKNVPVIPDDFRNLKEVKESELSVPDALKGKMLCRNVYHIFITDDYLVTDLNKEYTITRLEKYLNYLLLGTNYDFVPCVMSNEIRLRDIKTIVFKNPSIARENMKIDLDLKDKAKELVKQLFPLMDNIDEVMNDNIISAKMTLSIAKPDEMLDEDYERKLAYVLKPVSDPDIVSIGIIKGREIKGSDILYAETKEFEDDSLKDEDYIKAMKEIIATYELSLK